VHYDDRVLVAPEVADAGDAVDDNPDANAGSTTYTSSTFPNALGTGWACDAGLGVYPKGDADGVAWSGAGTADSGACSSATGPNTLLDGPIGVITFTGLAAGTTALSISAANLVDDNLSEIGSCAPVIEVQMNCVGGTITVANDPPACLPPLGVNIGTGRGVSADGGVADSLWRVVSGPTSGAAYPVTKPAAWVAPPGGTNWIDPNNTNMLISDANGTYVYEAAIEAPPTSHTLILLVQYAVDNDVTLTLDDKPLTGGTLSGGIHDHFNTLHVATAWHAHPGTGLHVLRATVTNYSGPVGFLLSGVAICRIVGGGVGGDVRDPDVGSLPSGSAAAQERYAVAAIAAAGILVVAGLSLTAIRQRRRA
jgi:hypothetical protein